MYEAFEKAKDEANKAHARASAEAEKIMRQLARRILSNNPKIEEFVKGMGSVIFCSSSGWVYNPVTDNIDHLGQTGDFDDVTDLTALKEFLSNYDNEYHMSGDPVRFTATGEEKTDW